MPLANLMITDGDFGYNRDVSQMATRFWVQRFFVVFAGAFLVIAVAQFLKHHDLSYVLKDGLIWAGATAAVFTAARIYQSSKGQHCAVCNDTPEMRQSNSANSQ